jgi:hypothetical protein
VHRVLLHACIVAEVLSAVRHQSLEGSTGLTHRDKSPAPGMLTREMKAITCVAPVEKILAISIVASLKKQFPSKHMCLDAFLFQIYILAY